MDGWILEALTASLWALGIVLMLVGLAGALLPALPGTPLILAGIVLLAWLNGFERIGPVTLLLFGLLSVLSLVIDFLATAEGARRFGAGRGAILGATLGLVVGLFFGLPGLLLGPFVGAVIGHRLGEANLADSMRAGVGASLGVIAGTLTKVVISIVMLVWFSLAWWL
ncbi:MAG: DUF456 family protein [Wenzhouxiangellaceae bacterium]|nr:DUF456 family protein [Wenzhouxiangellaceae bacterium]